MRAVRTGSYAPKQIMNELEAFYSDLYDGGACADTGSFFSFLSDLNEIPSLLEEKKTFVKANWGAESVKMFQRPSKRTNHLETTA